MRKLICLLTLLIFIMCSADNGGENKGSTQYITIGTGGVTGTYYPTGGAICRLVNKNKKESNVRCSVESTGGSVYNINNIKNGELDFGMTQSDVVYQAYNGTGKFEGKEFKGIRSVMAIYPELLTMVVNKKSGINTLEDTKGKRINIGNPGSGDEATTMLLYEEYDGISLEELSFVGKLKTSEAPDAIRDDKIDGYVFIVGHPTANIKDTTNSIDANIISLNGPKIDVMLEKYPYYAKGIIPGGIYKGIDNDIESFGVKAVLSTSESINEDAVYILVKSILENFDEFKKLHPAYSKITKESLLDGLSAPLHPGAEKYYKEIGLIN